ncbi:MAG: hypothetical protein Q8M92_05965 [Candidatus Subteraquimicrobiales bacterium]|nr:hypothetical protein [Candidatus Subteraquimicrobiales bacterium]
MSFILEFFETQFILKGVLFLILSLVFIWVTASIFSRTKLIVQRDIELKVYCGSLIAFGLYNVIVALFLILIARHYKELDISLWYTMPYLIALFVSFFLTLDINNKIQTKLLQIKNKGRK